MNGSGPIEARPDATPPRQIDLSKLLNPVWVSKDNLRDPSVLKTPEGYHVFYSRLSDGPGGWADPRNWAIACAFTRDFTSFDNDRDVSPKGFALPGDVVSWHGRYVLPFQSYPALPVRLYFSESKDLRQWSAPRPFLDEAAQLPWNGQHRVIDPSFVIDGDVLHCFFVGSAVHRGARGKNIRANLMGHAVTRDPELKRWEVLTRDRPLIGWSDRAPDGVENTMIFKTGDHWTMIYSEGLADQHLALATSLDLRDWKLEGPIAIPRQKWTARKYGAPFVWREGSQWLMILMGTSDRGRTTFGLLFSADGKRWTPLPEPADVPPIKVLIIDGFSNHDWARTTALVRGILERTGRFRVEVATCPAKADDPALAGFRPRLAEHDVVLVNCNSLGNGGQWPVPLRDDFVKFVRNGGGAFIFHSANNSFAGWADYDRIIGLGWRGKNAGTAIAIGPDGTLQRIRPGEGKGTSHGARTDRPVHRLGEHPIHAGLPRTWMAAMIEVYTYARGPAENLEVLSWAEDPATKTRWPIEWSVTFGKGRVYNSTFGHVWRGEADPPGMRCAGFQTVLVRALEWLARRPVDFPVPADFPTETKTSLRPL